MLSRIAFAAGCALLALLALGGVGLSALVGGSALPEGRAVIGRWLGGAVDGAIAGRVTIEGMAVARNGDLELHGLRILDPDGVVVLAVTRARASVDVARIASREVRVALELESPSIFVQSEPDGSLSLIRAFAPRGGGAAERPSGAGGSWTIGVTRLTARGGDLAWHRADGTVAGEVTGLNLDAAAALGAAGGFVDVRLRARAAAPLPGPLAIDAAVRLRGDRVEVPSLEASLGATVLAAVAEGDLGTRAFRAAVTRLGLSPADALRVASSAALTGDLAATAYAESDGSITTAALDAPPDGEASPAGTARVAVALGGAPGASSVGFDVALAALDPSRWVAQAPPGRVTLTARGSAAGRGLSDLRGRLTVEMAASRLRGSDVGPIAVTARAGDGLVEVVKLVARLPGLAVAGSGRWRDGGAVAGEATVDAADLGAFGRSITGLTGVALPAFGGRLRARATLAGTSVAPVVTSRLDAPALRAGTARAEAVKLAVEAGGPLAAARLRLMARAARAEVAGAEVRGLELTARLAGTEASVSLNGSLPAAGDEPLAVTGAARLTRDRRRAEVRELSLRWAGARFALARPSIATFAPPAVDQLELVDGPRSVSVAGGLDARGTLDLRLNAVRLDLAMITRLFLPPGAAVSGEVSMDARATGTSRRPSATARLTVTDGAVHGLTGLQVEGDVRWNGTGRIVANAGLVRTGGGALDFSADVPLALTRGRSGDPLALTVAASAWPVEALRRAAGLEAEVIGTLGGRVALSGTVAAPHLQAALTLEDASVSDLGPIAAALAVEGAPGASRFALTTRLASAQLLTVDARLPVGISGLLHDPARTVGGLARIPITGSAQIPGIDLGLAAGKLGLPQDLAGTLSGSARLGGTLSSPRGQGTLSVTSGAAAGYRDVAALVGVTADADRTAVTVRASLGGAEALRADAALGAPIERLADRSVLRAAPLSVDATVPRLPLARASGAALALSGTVSAKLAVTGTLAKPDASLDAAGEAVEVAGRPLGAVAALLRHRAAATNAELSIRPAQGGVLEATATLAAPLGLDDLDASTLRDAPATLRVAADQVELGFLPALIPSLVRSASGRLTMILAAAGPLGGLRPRGTMKLEGGRLAVTELGEWQDIEVVASLGERTIELSRLEARRRAGRLSGTLTVRDLGTPLATVNGRLVLQQLALTRAATDVAILDFPLELEGTLADRLLDATVTLPAGTIRLPGRPPRPLQSLEGRKDIAEVDAVVERPRGREATARRAEATAKQPFEVRCRLVLPGRLFVKSERPAANLEVKGDSTWHLVGTDLTADGFVEVVRGTAEPIAGRVFHVERGRVTFPGGAVNAAQLDVVARYDNPEAVVTVTIGGPVVKPLIQFSSRPAMDDAAIAMLIATGRTQINVNTTGVEAVTAQEAGAAVASAAVSAAFTGIVADRLPVDQISVDSSRIRAGKYVTDKLFLGYAYRLEAKPEENENLNEVTAEYQIMPRWNFVVRYGDAQAGDASLIWSKDY